MIVRHRSLLILTSVLTTGALTLTACGSRDDDKKSSGGENTTVVIGVDAPLSGDLSAIGIGIKNSVDLAAKTANKNKEVNGVTFKTEPLDDVANPSTGGQNATKLVGMDDVLGVVGPLNSSVAQSMQKTFASANLVQVSPRTPHPNSPRAPSTRPRRHASSTHTSAPRPPTRCRAPTPPNTRTTPSS